MEKRNLDLDVPVTREQWEQLGRTAASFGTGDSGYSWRAAEPEEIRVAIRAQDAPPGWLRFVTASEAYGADYREVGRFVFNDGDPYAERAAPAAAQEPAVPEAEQAAMGVEIDRWMREKWHDLMRASGLHFDRGHVPQG